MGIVGHAHEQRLQRDDNAPTALRERVRDLRRCPARRGDTSFALRPVEQQPQAVRLLAAGPRSAGQSPERRRHQPRLEEQPLPGRRVNAVYLRRRGQRRHRGSGQSRLHRILHCSAGNLRAPRVRRDRTRLAPCPGSGTHRLGCPRTSRRLSARCAATVARSALRAADRVGPDPPAHVRLHQVQPDQPSPRPADQGNRSSPVPGQRPHHRRVDPALSRREQRLQRLRPAAEGRRYPHLPGQRPRPRTQRQGPQPLRGHPAHPPDLDIHRRRGRRDDDRPRPLRTTFPARSHHSRRHPGDRRRPLAWSSCWSSPAASRKSRPAAPCPTPPAEAGPSNSSPSGKSPRSPAVPDCSATRRRSTAARRSNCSEAAPGATPSARTRASDTPSASWPGPSTT